MKHKQVKYRRAYNALWQIFIYCCLQIKAQNFLIIQVFWPKKMY